MRGFEGALMVLLVAAGCSERFEDAGIQLMLVLAWAVREVVWELRASRSRSEREELRERVRMLSLNPPPMPRVDIRGLGLEAPVLAPDRAEETSPETPGSKAKRGGKNPPFPS